MAIQDANDRMFGSVRAVTSSAVSALRYTTQQRAAPFSVRQWIRQGGTGHSDGRGGVLFIPYKAGEIAALRSTISAWMRIAIFEAMNRPEGDQRLWFVIDELDALGEIDGLYVPPEEYAEVKASGACWDDYSKRWYIGGGVESAPFSRWSGEAGEAEFGIESEEALVASAQTACVKCRERIEVICIYCESGSDAETGEPMTQFTVSNIWARDSALAAQLERWRYFRKETGAGSEDGCFANQTSRPRIAQGP